MKMSMPMAARAGLIERMAEIEHRLAYGTTDRVQLGALVGAFVEARQAIVQAAR